MTAPRTFNVYCDESCHLEHDDIPVMAWGAISCPTGDSRAIAEAVRALKTEHGLAPDFEAKWGKVSPAQAAFYVAMIDLFLADERLRFRGLVVPDKNLLDHKRFDQTHDDWYYKMYFTMLRPIFTAPHRKPQGQNYRASRPPRPGQLLPCRAAPRSDRPSPSAFSHASR